MPDVSLPSLFIPHGGGPCFFMDPPPGHPTLWQSLERYLRGLPERLPAPPRALLVVSGHWTEAVPTVNAAPAHSLYFDYYNFPAHTYALQYPVAGAPALAARVRALLAQAGFATAETASRGLDHGVFIPLMVAWPDAAIPVVQLSLQEGHDAATHLAIGRALSSLRDEGVLIVGSGMSYHNLRLLFRQNPDDDEASRRFDDWLTAAVEETDPTRRLARLRDWEAAPDAQACHPEAEHLLPLLVAAGAAPDAPATRDYGGDILGKRHSGFRFD